MSEQNSGLEWKNRGNQHFRNGDTLKALEAYSKAIELEPRNAIYYSNRAAAYTFNNQFDKAVADAKVAVKVDENYAKGWVRLGVAQYSRGFYDKAMEAFESAKKRAASDSDLDNQIREECESYLRLCREQLQALAEKSEEEFQPVANDLRPKGDEECYVFGQTSGLRGQVGMVELKDVPDNDRDGYNGNNEDLTEDVPMLPRGQTEHIEIDVKPKPPFGTKKWFFYYCNPGDLSNIIGGIIALTGLLMKYVNNPVTDNGSCGRESCAYEYVLGTGLFAVSGGVTNWVAIKMLFNKVPGLYGTGIIPMKFKEIRLVLKNVVMKNFFDETYLNFYLKDKVLNMDIEGKLTEFLNSDKLETVLEAVLGDDAKMLTPIVRPFLKKTGVSLAPILKEKIRHMDLMKDLESVNSQIDKMLTTRLEELTPEKVKMLLSEVMKEHLYWLIIWGNVFGGILGLITTAIGV